MEEDGLIVDILFGGKRGRYVQVKKFVVILGGRGEDDADTRFADGEGRCLVGVIMFPGEHGVASGSLHL